MNPVLRQARHEWGLVLREPRFLIPFVAAPVFLLILHAAATIFLPVGPTERGLLTRSFLAVLSLMGASMAIPLGADSFAGEKERQSWETLLCLPLSRGQLFAGKALGVLPFPLTVGWGAQGAALIIAASGQNGLPPVSYWAPALILTPFLSVFFCSLSVLISLRSETVRGAAQMTGLFLLLIFPAVTVGAQTILDRPAALAAVVAGLGIGSAGCFTLASRRMPT